MEATNYMTAAKIEETTGIKISTIKRMRLDSKINDVRQLGKRFLYNLDEIISKYEKMETKQTEAA